MMHAKVGVPVGDTHHGPSIIAQYAPDHLKFGVNGASQNLDYSSRFNLCGSHGKWDYDDVVTNPLYVIVQEYKKGQTIKITIEVTAHHMGHMEVGVCDTKELNGGKATWDCVSKHMLKTVPKQGVPYDADHPVRAFLPPRCAMSSQGLIYEYELELPPNLVCEHCVLHWWWITANSCIPAAYTREIFKQASGKYACGAWWNPTVGPCYRGAYPEEFFNCADIKITEQGPSDSYQPIQGPGEAARFAEARKKNEDYQAPPVDVAPRPPKPLTVRKLPRDIKGNIKSPQELPVLPSETLTADQLSWTAKQWWESCSSHDPTRGSCHSFKKQITHDWCIATGCDPNYYAFCTDTKGQIVTSPHVTSLDDFCISTEGASERDHCFCFRTSNCADAGLRKAQKCDFHSKLTANQKEKELVEIVTKKPKQCGLVPQPSRWKNKPEIELDDSTQFEKVVSLEQMKKIWALIPESDFAVTELKDVEAVRKLIKGALTTSTSYFCDFANCAEAADDESVTDFDAINQREMAAFFAYVLHLLPTASAASGTSCEKSYYPTFDFPEDVFDKESFTIFLHGLKGLFLLSPNQLDVRDVSGWSAVIWSFKNFNRLTGACTYGGVDHCSPDRPRNSMQNSMCNSLSFGIAMESLGSYICCPLSDPAVARNLLQHYLNVAVILGVTPHEDCTNYKDCDISKIFNGCRVLDLDAANHGCKESAQCTYNETTEKYTCPSCQKTDATVKGCEAVV